jgi:hypothetical protein
MWPLDTVGGFDIPDWFAGTRNELKDKASKNRLSIPLKFYFIIAKEATDGLIDPGCDFNVLR